MTAFKTLAAALIAGAVLPVSAANFDFANLKYNSGVNSGFLPTDGVSCTGGDLCSSNVDGGVRNGDLSFSTGGITVHATGKYNGSQAAVVQDHENTFPRNAAGLGVYHKSGDFSDDNVTTGESLKLSFDQVVNLSSLGLRAEGHNVTNWVTGATFLFSVDGGAQQEWLLPKGTGTIGSLNITGTTFEFTFGGSHADQFYLSAMTVGAVPEPETYALMVAGLAAVGFVARRRKAYLR